MGDFVPRMATKRCLSGTAFIVGSFGQWDEKSGNDGRVQSFALK